MSVELIEKNNATNHFKFSYDNWDSDKDSIPNLNTPGKGILSTIKSCSQGSIAIGTDGSKKILTGNNQWVEYKTTLSGSSGSGELIDAERITDEEIMQMF